MNSQSQTLKKQVTNLSASNDRLAEMVLDAAADRDLYASVACAFAWDLAVELAGRQTVFYESEPEFWELGRMQREALNSWDEALEAARKAGE